MKLPLLLLAAGRSRRFGDRDKRLCALPKGGAMLPALARRAAKAGTECFVVLAERDRASAGFEGLSGRCLYAASSERGMGSSLGEGMVKLLAHYGARPSDFGRLDRVAALPEAVLVMPADLPLLRISSIARVAAAAAEGAIVRPRCQGRAGHPVAFGRAFWPQLCQMAGPQGARSVIAGAGERVHYCELDDPGIYSDVDTPEQLSGLASQFSPP